MFAKTVHFRRGHFSFVVFAFYCTIITTAWLNCATRLSDEISVKWAKSTKVNIERATPEWTKTIIVKYIQPFSILRYTFHGQCRFNGVFKYLFWNFGILTFWSVLRIARLPSIPPFTCMSIYLLGHLHSTFTHNPRFRAGFSTAN